jgi:hypothetical protein
MATGALLQLLVSHRLLDLKDLAQGTGLADVFVFIDRHIAPCLPFESAQAIPFFVRSEVTAQASSRRAGRNKVLTLMTNLSF